MTCILELNDADLTLYRDRAVLHRAPGVAVVLDDQVTLGEEALRLSRIHPRQANQHYFTRLSAEPLPVPGRRARNHADLVYLHLKTFQPLVEAEGGTLLLAVPGILSADQLGVLLGVLQEVGIRVTGFVDSAVAALSTRPLPERAYHLDVTLQRAVVTSVEAGTNVSKTGAQELPECGLTRLLDAWINVIADRFVSETRFDPLHAAATEQQLFNQIYDWIERGAATPEMVVEIVHADHTRRVEFARALFEEKAQQRLAQIAEVVPRGAPVFLSARSARLPGMQRMLDTLGVQSHVLPDDALPHGCLENLRHIVPADGELRLVTRLPLVAPARSAEPLIEPQPRAPQPTHALLGYEAWPLDAADAVLPLRRESGRLRLDAAAGVLLNGRPAPAGAELAPGDRVAVGEQEYLLIRLRE